MKNIDFIYDFGSPNAYLVHKVLPGIAARHGACVRYCPILIGGVFKATNNQPPLMAFSGVMHKIDYIRLEIDRFIRRYDVPFRFNPHFPVMTIAVMRGAVFAQGKDWEQTYTDTVFDALWLHGRKMDDPDVIAAELTKADLPAAEIMAATQIPDIKEKLAEFTAAAVARKVFGAPTMFFGDEMFFGKDALDDLDWALGQAGA